MSKIFIYSDDENDVSWENVFLSTKYKDLKHFKKENPDLRPIVSYNVKDVIGVDVEQLEQQIAKLKTELKEAVEVVEFYGNHLDDLTIYDDESFVMGRGEVYGKRARQFIAKYRGRINEHI